MPGPTATPDIAATVNAAVSQALGTPIDQPTGIRSGHCERLCDPDFLLTAGLEEVRSELNRGTDIEARGYLGWTPLHIAAGFNTEPAVIALLLDRSANIEAKDNDGWTPLFSAAAFNTEPAVIALLLDRGADITARTPFGETACQIAERVNRETDIRRLLCR